MDKQIDEIQVSVLEQAKEIKLALVEKEYDKAFEITNQLINDFYIYPMMKNTKQKN